MTDLVRETHVEGLPLIHRGKVRETYAVGDDRLLLVATDRLSRLRRRLRPADPRQGPGADPALRWWFGAAGVAGPDPLPVDRPRRLAAGGRTGRSSTAGSMLVRRAERIDAECVVRGYLAGSGWAEYRRSGAVVRPSAAATACARPIELPEPIFTPSTKAEVGHDENITREQLADMVGAELARQLEERSLALYRAGAERGAERAA